MRSTYIIFVCALVILLTARVSAASDSTLTLTHESVLLVVPDQAIIHIGLDIFNSVFDEGKEIAHHRKLELLRIVAEFDISVTDIRTSQFGIGIGGTTASVLIGIGGFINTVVATNVGSGLLGGNWYRIEFAVTLKRLDQLSDFVKKILDHGANRFFIVEFLSSRLKDWQLRARIMAVRGAKAKAEVLADEFGVVLGLPTTIEDVDVASTALSPSSSRTTYHPEERHEKFDKFDFPIGHVQVRAAVRVVFVITAVVPLSVSATASVATPTPTGVPTPTQKPILEGFPGVLPFGPLGQEPAINTPPVQKPPPQNFRTDQS